MSNQYFLKKEAFAYGWETMKKNFWFFAGMLAIIFAVAYGIPLLGDSVIKQYLNNNQVILFFFNLIINIAAILINIGFIRIVLNVFDNKPVEYFQLFNQWRLFIKYLLASILYGLIVLGGFILLIVPGIIFILKFQFYPYLIVEGYGVFEALSRSSHITKGVKWDLFLFSILSGLISLAGLIALGIGVFAAYPVVAMAMAYVYRKLQARPKAEEISLN